MTRLLLLGTTLCVLASAQSARQAPLPDDVEEQLGLAVPMRDGVRLAADVFFPKRYTRWPAILIRTPYGRKSPGVSSYRFFARRGYAVVIEDVRGRYASQGTFGSISQEGPDGNDTINWISEQPWSNGRVAMAGGSYLGIAQWWAAIQNNPHLITIAPAFSGDDEYRDRFYSAGGAFQLAHRLLWFAQNETPPSRLRPPLADYIDHLPLLTADLAATGVVLPAWRTALRHPSYDAYWKRLSIRNSLNRISIPVLSFGGWFDVYAPDDLDAFSKLAQQGKPIETWIGPWGHNPSFRFPTYNFGPQAHISFRLKQLAWFEEWLKRPEFVNPPRLRPTLHIFVMGPNVWREEHEWPLARTHYEPLYLNSGGHANSDLGDGTLQWAPVRKAQPDLFTYDPKRPVPTSGGALCCDPRVLPPGPLDQAPVENRKDVLVYSSPPLSETLEVTGPVKAILYVSTSVNDTDFTVKLVDVQPDGRPLLVTDGIQQLRYRLSLDEPVFVKRNTAYQITVEAGVTSYIFEPGHRIRVEVSSSNFPRFGRNLNQAWLNAEEVKTIKAKQTVYHEKGYPSAIILPVIPTARSTEPRP